MEKRGHRSQATILCQKMQRCGIVNILIQVCLILCIKVFSFKESCQREIQLFRMTLPVMIKRNKKFRKLSGFSRPFCQFISA